MKKIDSDKKIIELSGVSKEFILTGKGRVLILPKFIDLLKRDSKKEKVIALDDISFKVGSDEVVGIIGNNGSGKSTLLKIIAGIYRPNKGSIYTDNPPLYLTGFGAGINTRLSLRENIFLTGYVMGLDKKTIEGYVDKIMKFADLEGLLDRQLKTLSTGMNSRFSYSTFIHFANELSPDIILLDEVLGGGGGDIRFKKWGIDKMEELIGNGKAVILVTHSMNLVKRYCTRAIWLNDGRIVSDGRPDEIVARYEKAQGED